MKKSIIALLIIAMLACIGLVSCKNEVQAPAEELVSVSFDNDSSRALSASLEDFKPGDYFWKYAAKKADASNLISGQTATYNEAGAQWIREGKAGFADDSGSYRVPGFSQGLWNFTLYGYKKIIGDNPATTETVETDYEYYVLVYSGETTGVLLKSAEGYHTVSAVVSPVQGENGTLWVKVTGDDRITLDPAVSGLTPNADIWLTVEKIVGETTTEKYNGFVTADYKSSLEAGTYKVTVKFTNGDPRIIPPATTTDTVTYASGSVVATVYSGLTTTVKGNLTEVVTYADFGAQQNPDIITETIGTSAINQGTSSETVAFTSSSSTTKVTASMPTAAAKSLITEMEQALDAKTSTSTSTTSDLTLNLSVNTTAATETSITYEIGMEATLVYEKKDAQSSQKTTTKSTVETLNKFVTVEIDLQKNLQDVAVIHGTDSMTSCTQTEFNNKTETDDPNGIGFFYYDSANGKLHIKTWKFSPFTLSYIIPEVVAAIGSETYYSLESAVSAVSAGQTIQLLKDITFDKDYSVAVWTKAFNLDLNGHTIETKSEVGKDLSNGGYTASAICYSVKGNVAVKNGTIKTAYGAGIYADEVTMTIENVVIKAAQTGVQATDEYSSAVRLTGGAKVTIESGSFEAGNGGHAVAVSNSGGDVVINGGTFKSDLFISASTDAGVSKTISITGGKFYHNPSAYVAEGYCAEHHDAEGQDPEYWIVIKKPEAPMARVIRYVDDKTDSDEMAHATITSAEVVTLDLVSEMKEIMRALPVTDIDLTSANPFADYSSLIAAIQTGTLVTFMPKFDAAGKTVGDLPESDAYYCGVNIDNVDSWEEFKNTTFEGWRTDFRIITEDTFGEDEISLVGYYYFRDNDGNVILNTGCVSIENIGPRLGIGEEGSVSVMNDLFGGFFAIPYDLLLGACSTMDGVRYGFNCGAYATSNTPIQQQKQITVQLILTNDNLPGVVEPETIVCAEVVCTFHAPDTDENTLMQAVLSQLDDSRQLVVTKDGDNSVEPEYMSLATFRNNVNNGTDYSGYTATLLENVDLVGSVSNQWIPIGNSGTTPFKGTFDGADHTISGLFMKDPNSGEDFALFCYVEDATIKNLTVEGSITAKDSAAGVVMKAYGNTTVENVVNRVDVTAYNKVGGVICSAYPSYSYNPKGVLSEDRVIVVKNCRNEGALKCLGQSNNATHIIAGAIVAYAGQFGRVECKDCINTGVVKAISQYVEGVVGTGSSVASYAVGWCANNVNVANSDTNGCYITNCTNVGSDNLVMVKKDMTETKRNDIVVGYAAGCGTVTNSKHYNVYVRTSVSDEFTVINSATTVYIRNGQIYTTAD